MSAQVPLYGSVKYGCARWDCSRSGLYELISTGKIRAIKDGARTKVDIASGDAHFASLPDFMTSDKAKCDPRRKGR
jgi:hypothetical protein